MFKNKLSALMSAKGYMIKLLFSYCFVYLPKAIFGIKLKMSKTKYISVLVPIFMVPASLAFASIDIAPLQNEFGAPITSVGGGVGLLMGFVRWIYTIIFIVAVFFILLSAYNFITSSGDPTKVEKAKTQLTYALIGIAIAIVSFSLVFLVNNFLSGSSASVPATTPASNSAIGPI